MRQILIILAAASLLSTGCSLIGCDRVFPKLTWYWSAEAKRCRDEHRQERIWQQQQATNSAPLPPEPPKGGTPNVLPVSRSTAAVIAPPTTRILSWTPGYVLSWPDPVAPTAPLYTQIYYSTVLSPQLANWQFIGNFTNQTSCTIPWNDDSNNFACVREVWPGL